MKQLFSFALELNPDERDTYLKNACGSDEGLLAELQALISTHESNERKSDNAPVLLSASGRFDERRIGQYRVIHRIGSGGMGDVYLAARDDDAFTKRVAIKVLQAGIDTQEILKRFRHERQILAALDHPNIARLLDGGTTDEGIPYFVMDYVEGAPIDSYCDTHRLAINERVRLFRQICLAVHYVHQNLIVHRDLKPGNILVTPEGVPKLLDFGIAKLLKPEFFAHAVDATRIEFRLMTPWYASPEQVRGETVTTASDVYSLGVILYELLTSRRPYKLNTDVSNEILRAVCDEEPERPSSSVFRVHETSKSGRSLKMRSAAQLAERRDTTASKLQRQLRGDLDVIVLKSIRKEPQRRYSSAEQFAEDLRRYLEGLPIVAHRDSRRYRAGKFVRRHKAGVIAAAAVFLSLIAGVFATAWQTRIARHERAEAQRHFNDVRGLATSLLFEFNNAIQNLPGSTPARQLVVQKGLEYLSKLAEESHGDPGLEHELANAYLKLGDIQGNPYASNVGDVTGAAASYRKALDISKKLVQADGKDQSARLDLARSHKQLGQVLPILGKPTEAAVHLRTASEILESLAASDVENQFLQSELAQCYQALGDVLGHGGMQNLGEQSAALTAYQKALAIDEAQAVAHPDSNGANDSVPLLQIRIGDIKLDQDDLQTSLTNYRQALEKLETSSASDRNDTARQGLLALAYRKVGVVQDYLGNNSQALKNYLKAAAIDREQVDADPTNVRAGMGLAISLRYAGELQEKTGNLPQAIVYNREIIQIFEKLSAANSNNVVLRGRYAEILIATAKDLAETHDLVEARRMSARGLALDRELAQREDVTSDDLAQYALDFFTCEPTDLRDPAAAQKYIEHSIAKSENPENLDILAQIYFKSGDRERAIATEQKAIGMIPSVGNPKLVSPLRVKLDVRLATFRADIQTASKR
jgi:non-specific serine/threonine protein kinase/serine/threonine-protein kinase